jgi:hypothetical protein
MAIYYSSMYVREVISDFDELVNRNIHKQMKIYVDANICIYIRDFIREPQTIISREDIWDDLKIFFWNVKQYNMCLDYSFGIDEASRNKNNFEINYEKLDEMVKNIDKFSRMSYSELLEHSNLSINNRPAKDQTSKSKTKIDSLEKVSEFQKLLYITYASLLKLYILDKNKQSESNTKLMMRYIDFLDEEVNLINISNLAFAYHYFNEGKIKKIIHSKQKATEDIIHTLWNAAIDLTLPTLVSIKLKLIGSKTIPIFVTSDESLWLFFNTLKVNTLFTYQGKVGIFPPFIEVDLSQTNWKQIELNTLKQYYRDKKRIYKALKRIDEIDFIDKMRNISRNLELEAKQYMTNESNRM